MTKLGDVAEVVMGQAPSGDTYNEDGIGTPLIAGAGDFKGAGIVAKKYTTKPSKLVGRDEIVLSIRASIGAHVRTDREYCLGRGVAAVVPDKTRLDGGYLWHWIESARNELTARGRGATFLQVSKADIAEMNIPLPPLPEQSRIADILDRADDLRAQRRRALMFLGELAESALTRISDTSSKVVAFGDVATIDAKLVDPREDSYASYPLVAPDNIESNTGRIQNVRATAEVAPISGKYLFTESDVLYSKIRPALNKVALPDFAGLCSADMYPISVNAGEINREFLWATLRPAAFLAHA